MASGAHHGLAEALEEAAADDVALGAHPRIHHADVNRAYREVLVGTREPETRFSRPINRHFVSDVDDSGLRQVRQDPPLHRGDEWPLMTEVGGDRDDAAGR